MAPRKHNYRNNWPAELNLTSMDDDLDAVADTAAAITEAVRQHDPIEFHKQLTLACTQEPARMAQVVMALGAWVDPEEPLSARFARVEAASAPATQKAAAS